MSTFAGNGSSSGDDAPASRGWRLAVAAIVTAAFAVYWASSFALVARQGHTHFGGDPWLYAELAKADPFDRLESISRITRFHPMTVLLGIGWLKIASPLTAWLAPGDVLRALFAAFGAIGVWGAISAFAAVVPRRQALIWGTIYAASLGVWYFASIEESKALSAALSALYIAVYVRLRSEWTLRRAMLLTLVLAAACLNEIVAIFLVAIPAIDALCRRGIDLREDYWVGLHALVGPAALLVMEVAARLLLPVNPYADGTSHVGMLLYYIARNDYSLPNLYMFVVRWFFFNIAAPERTAFYWIRREVGYGGDFLPTLGSYLTSPLSTVLAIAAVGLALALIAPRWRGRLAAGRGTLLVALAVYALVRMLFFLLFNPWECLLFASSVTLPHLMLIAAPFAASRIPFKAPILLVLVSLLLASNGRFIIG